MINRKNIASRNQESIVKMKLNEEEKYELYRHGISSFPIVDHKKLILYLGLILYIYWISN